MKKEDKTNQYTLTMSIYNIFKIQLIQKI